MMLMSREDLLARIERHWNATRKSGRHPIGLHCWPKNVKCEHWYGVGPVNYGANQPDEAWFDIRLADHKAYRELNELLRSVCQQLEIPYINMA